MTRIALAAAALLLAGTAAAGEARTYELDPGKSSLYVLVKYDRNSMIAGHDHVVKASTFKGTVTWNPDDLSACKVDIAFPVTALEVDPPGSREKAGLSGSTSDGDKGKIKANLSGASQLDASSHPQITFSATKCEAAGEVTKVTGKMSIRGVAKEVTAEMKVAAGDTFTAKGSFMATHQAWGFDPFSAVLGALKNDTNLGFHIDVVGSPK